MSLIWDAMSCGRTKGEDESPPERRRTNGDIKSLLRPGTRATGVLCTTAPSLHPLPSRPRVRDFWIHFVTNHHALREISPFYVNFILPFFLFSFSFFFFNGDFNGIVRSDIIRRMCNNSPSLNPISKEFQNILRIRLLEESRNRNGKYSWRGRGKGEATILVLINRRNRNSRIPRNLPFFNFNADEHSY